MISIVIYYCGVIIFHYSDYYNHALQQLMMFYYYYFYRIQYQYRYIFRCLISTILLLLLLGLQAAQESVLKLVPIESRRRFYQRVFKWVVAFATWRYGEVRTRLREGNTHSSSNSGATCAVLPNPHRTPTKSSTMVSCYIYQYLSI